MTATQSLTMVIAEDAVPMSLNPDIPTLIGGLAAIASTSSFAPQAWKIIKSRQTKDISLGMYGLTVFGFALWLAYGLLLGQWPLIVTNGICLLLALFILIMKILPANGKNAVADALDPDPHASPPSAADGGE